MTILRQTIALLIDAYRELAAGKIFWITMLLNLLVVGALASVGIDEEGIHVLVWHMSFIPINSDILPPDLFYKSIITDLGVKFWLSWVATILALVSTAGIIPSFVASGSIELHLAKPIGRARLFLTKFASGLIFSALQVFVFSLGAFLLLGVRGGDWEPRLFIAVPIVVAFFSYLFSVAALLGLLTRSTIASLLITLLLWGVVFLVNVTDSTIGSWKTMQELRLENTQTRIDQAERIARNALELRAEQDDPLPPSEEWAPGIDDELEAAYPILSTFRDDRAELEESAADARRWHSIVVGVKTALPKTQETLQLLDRSLLTEADYERLISSGGGDQNESINIDDDEIDPQELQRRVLDEQLGRTTLWILGTSFAFEAFILGIAAWRFSRRDF